MIGRIGVTSTLKILLTSAFLVGSASAYADALDVNYDLDFGGPQNAVMVTNNVVAATVAPRCGLASEEWSIKLTNVVQQRIKANPYINEHQRTSLYLLSAQSAADARDDWRRDSVKACAAARDDLERANTLLSAS